MPKIKDMMETETIDNGAFQFSAVNVDDLENEDYTLVTIAVDTSGSVSKFKTELEAAIVAAVEACKLNNRSENIMLRLVTFDSSVTEGHGFKLVCDCDPADYTLQCGGYTTLYDAVYSSVAATLQYSETLHGKDFETNSILFIITDGEDNSSKKTPADVKAKVEEAIAAEQIDSIATVLIGINAGECKQYLEDFASNAGLTTYVDFADASPESLAKLTGLISQSISSTSQAIGTGSTSLSI